MNRSDKHIDLTLEIVRRFWKRNRDQRLCQLIVNTNGGEDPFSVEDGTLMERMSVGEEPPGEIRLNPFLCHACGKHKEGMLIRGLCKDCAPGLHEKYRCDNALMSELNLRFKKETGKDSLEDWFAFEDWLEENRK